MISLNQKNDDRRFVLDAVSIARCHFDAASKELFFFNSYLCCYTGLRSDGNGGYLVSVKSNLLGKQPNLIANRMISRNFDRYYSDFELSNLFDGDSLVNDFFFFEFVFLIRAVYEIYFNGGSLTEDNLIKLAERSRDELNSIKGLLPSVDHSYFNYLSLGVISKISAVIVPMINYSKNNPNSSTYDNANAFIDCFYKYVAFPLFISYKNKSESHIGKTTSKRLVDNIFSDYLRSRYKFDKPSIKEIINGSDGFFDDLVSPFGVFRDAGADSAIYSIRNGFSMRDQNLLMKMFTGVSPLELDKFLDYEKSIFFMDELLNKNKFFNKIYSKLMTVLNEDLFNNRYIRMSDRLTDFCADGKCVFNSGLYNLNDSKKNAENYIFVDYFCDLITIVGVDKFGEWFSKNNKVDRDKTGIMMSFLIYSFGMFFVTYGQNNNGLKVKMALADVLMDVFNGDISDFIAMSIVVLDENKTLEEICVDYKSGELIGAFSFSGDLIRNLNLNNSMVGIAGFIRICKLSHTVGKPINLKRSFYNDFYNSEGFYKLSSCKEIGAFSDHSIYELMVMNLSSKKLDGLLMNANKNTIRASEYLLLDYIKAIEFYGDDFLGRSLLFNSIVNNVNVGIVNPIIWSLFTVYDYLKLAIDIGLVFINDEDLKFINEYKIELSKYSIFMKKNSIDICKYLKFNNVFSKYYKEIVRIGESSVSKSLPSNILDLYKVSKTIGDWTGKIVKPSKVLSRYVSSMLSGSNNYIRLNSNSNMNNSVKCDRNHLIVGKSKLSYSHNRKVSGFNFYDKLVTYSNFLDDLVSLDMFNNEKLIKEKIFNVDYYLNEIIETSESLKFNGQSLLAHNFSPYSTGSDFILESGLNYGYWLSQNIRFNDGFLSKVNKSRFDNGLIIPVEFSRKNPLGDKVDIHYYYILVLFNIGDDGKCTDISITSNDQTNFAINSYYGAYNDYIEPIFLDIINEMYLNNFNIVRELN